MELFRRFKHAIRRFPEASLRLKRQIGLSLMGIPWNQTVTVLYAPKIGNKIDKKRQITDSLTISTSENSGFGFQLEHHFVPRYAIQLKDALIHCHTGNVFLRNDVTNNWELVKEFSEWPIESRAVFAKRPKPHQTYLRLEGAYLNGFISSNHYHQITEDIPSLLAIFDNQKIVAREKDFDKLATFGLSNFQSHLDHEFIQVETLDILTKGNDVGYLHPRSRELLLNHSRSYMNNKAFRNIYLSRLNQRRTIPNEMDVIQILESRGFEIIDPGELSLDKQISLFSEAKVVIAPHGGAITNMIFSQEARLLELMPSSRVNRCFEWQAKICGQVYEVLFFDDKLGIKIDELKIALQRLS